VEIPGTYREQKRLTIYFDGDVVTHFDGDYSPTPITPPDVPAEITEDDEDAG
jgi:hypothetical protein